MQNEIVRSSLSYVIVYLTIFRRITIIKRNHIKLNMAKPEKSGDAKLKGLSRCMTASCTYDNEALLLGISE